MSAQNIDNGYSLEPPQRGGSSEYHNLGFENIDNVYALEPPQRGGSNEYP